MADKGSVSQLRLPSEAHGSSLPGVSMSMSMYASGPTEGIQSLTAGLLHGHRAGKTVLCCISVA